MRNIDPRIAGLTVGIDHLFKNIDKAFSAKIDAFPPYNMEKTGEDSFRITMALAGYSEDEISIVSQDRQLTITGTKADEEKSDDENVFMIHRGIANRSFERNFNLAEYVEVKGASMKNGMLVIELLRNVPEEKQPTKIKINVE